MLPPPGWAGQAGGAGAGGPGGGRRGKVVADRACLVSRASRAGRRNRPRAGERMADLDARRATRPRGFGARARSTSEEVVHAEEGRRAEVTTSRSRTPSRVSFLNTTREFV